MQISDRILLVPDSGADLNTGTITPATASAATDEDAAARVDIAQALELRRYKRLTLGEKIRLHSTVLRVPQNYHLPVQETTSRSTTCDIII